MSAQRRSLRRSAWPWPCRLMPRLRATASRVGGRPRSTHSARTAPIVLHCHSPREYVPRPVGRPRVTRAHARRQKPYRPGPPAPTMSDWRGVCMRCRHLEWRAAEFTSRFRGSGSRPTGPGFQSQHLNTPTCHCDVPAYSRLSWSGESVSVRRGFLVASEEPRAGWGRLHR
jgi:hypothetical protein